MDDHALRNGVMYAHSGIQRRKRILKDHLHLSPQVHPLLSFRMGDIFSVEDNVP